MLGKQDCDDEDEQVTETCDSVDGQNGTPSFMARRMAPINAGVRIRRVLTNPRIRARKPLTRVVGRRRKRRGAPMRPVRIP